MNNLNYAFRYLLKSRGNNIIRILSLTMGTAFGLLLFLYINYSLTFDSFFPNCEQIYKVIGHSTQDGQNPIQQAVVAPLAPTMQDEIAQVEAATHIYGVMSYDYKYNESTFPLQIIAIDSMFFDVLDFGVVQGNPKDIYSNEQNVMLSETQAKIMFGNANPIGKVIMSAMNNKKVVCGIFKDPPLNNHLGEFNMLQTLHEVERNMNTNWDGNRDFQTYVRLIPQTKTQDVEAQIPAMIERHGAAEQMQQLGLTYHLLPITKVHPSEGTRMQYIHLFTLLAVLLILVSAVNYILLSISSFVHRAKTVAMLRCNGARRFDVAKIFLNETGFMLAISIVLSALIIFCLQNAINQFSDIRVTELFALHNIWVTAAVIIGIFLLSGILPAILFSSIPLTTAFKGLTPSRSLWKKTLLFFQLSGITFVLIFLIVSQLQFNQLTKSDQGYKFDKLVFVNLMGNFNNFLNYEAELMQLPEVEYVGTAYSLPAYGYGSKSVFDQNAQMLFTSFTDAVTPNYFETMQMKFIEGRTFNQTSPTNDVVVNKEFVRLHGWEGQAINQEFWEGTDNNKLRYRIIGVIDDFRVRADEGKIIPIVFHNIRENMASDNMYYGGCRTMIHLRDLNPENIAIVKNKIDKWYSTDNHHVTAYSEVHAQVMKGERNFKNVLLFSSILTLLIALIGLWGYLNDETNRRNKEIAIRRINGAKVNEILTLLAKGIASIAIPATIIGIAISYLVTKRWLQQFTNRTELTWWIFLLGSLVVLIIVYSIQIMRTWRAANANPVEYLNNE